MAKRVRIFLSTLVSALLENAKKFFFREKKNDLKVELIRNQRILFSFWRKIKKIIIKDDSNAENKIFHCNAILNEWKILKIQVIALSLNTSFWLKSTKSNEREK